jgi:16S rRNA (cytosine1402-N4)-methyltransferase
MKKKKKPQKPKKIDKSQAIEYDYHLPILLNECLDYLFHEENVSVRHAEHKELFIDGTLGGGGHSGEILKKLIFGGKLMAFDKDPDAIANAKSKFASFLQGDQPLLELHNQCFSRAYNIKGIEGKINGFLLDLGVSSHQLDTANRGISYRENANLDMRFGIEGITAKDFLNSASEEEITHVLLNYGEEPFSRVIVRRLIEKRRANALNSTFDLRDAVEQAVPQHLLFKSLSRVFQAIRIKVNSELDILENTLENIVPSLAIGGRLVIITFHSLEDRIVKNKFRTLSDKNLLEKNPNHSLLKIITKKPILPNENEISHNPRARSAKLRIAERVQ